MVMRNTPLNRLLTKTLNQQINSGYLSTNTINATSSNNGGLNNNKVGKLEGKFICDISTTDGEMVVL